MECITYEDWFYLTGRQTQIFKIQNTKQNNFILEALNFEFVHPVK